MKVKEEKTARPRNPEKMEKTVFAFYYNWYTTPKAWKGAAHQPLLGKYDSLNKNVIHQHFNWAE